MTTTTRTHKPGMATVWGLFLLLGVAGCASPTASAAAPIASAPSSAAATGGGQGAGGLVTISGPGWSATGLDGAIPEPGSCHIRKSVTGQPLPDPACTPGVVDSTVSPATLGTTVCRKGGYTTSVRPPEGMTSAAKKKIMAAYGIPWSEASKYELDHLVELADGGASDVRNLWPEPNTFASGTASKSAFVHNDKDQVEADVFDALCSGRTDLLKSQQAMAADWSSASTLLGLGSRKDN